MAYLNAVRLLTFDGRQGRLRASSLVVGGSFGMDEPCAVAGAAFARLGRGAKEARKAYSMPRSASADQIRSATRHKGARIAGFIITLKEMGGDGSLTSSPSSILRP